MDWFSWILLLFFISLFIYLIHIPLPKDIADRNRLIVLEFSLRLFNEYLADLIETFLGPFHRNNVLRVVTAVVFSIPRKPADYLTIKWDHFDGVPVRVYRPKVKKTNAALVYIHGGGWSTMKAEYYDRPLSPLVDRLGCSIFSIEYRLSPEHPFPSALEDCEAVIKYLIQDKAKEYGIDPSKIIIMGDSAGGNLSAAITLRLRAQGLEKRIKAQILIYPVVHMFSFRSPSFTGYFTHYNGSALLNPASVARWSLFYLGEKGSHDQVDDLLNNRHINQKILSLPQFSKNIPESHLGLEDLQLVKQKPNEKLASVFLKKAMNPEICPIFADSLKDLPKSMVLTAGYDVLRDEGILYAKKLKSDGVETNWKHYPTGYHGVFNMPGSQIRKEMLEDISQFLSPIL